MIASFPGGLCCWPEKCGDLLGLLGGSNLVSPGDAVLLLIPPSFIRLVVAIAKVLGDVKLVFEHLPTSA